MPRTATWASAYSHSIADGVVVWNTSRPAEQVALHHGMSEIARMKNHDNILELIRMIVLIWNCYCQVVGAILLLGIIFALTYHITMLFLWLSIFTFPVFWRMQKRIRFWFGLSAAIYLSGFVSLLSPDA